MSSVRATRRRVHTGVDASGAVPIEYRFSHARNGNRHLVVVFANFTAPEEYGWSNGVLDKVRGNILWIRDFFDGANSYYLCKGMDFSLEKSVAALITRVMTDLSLTPDDCTVFGSSKGGSAALYFGLKYGFRNILAAVPQFLIGSYVRAGIPGAARLMMGEVSEENVRLLDAVLPKLVRDSPHRDANIYLLSSPQDQQYSRQVQPFLSLFRDYTNFNFLFNDSPLIEDHSAVTTRNLPTIMGVLNLLVEGIAPRLGRVHNGGEQPDRDASSLDAFLARTALVRGDSFPRPVVLSPAPDEKVPANAVRFAGTAHGGVRVSIWENGTYLGSAPVTADGSWSWEAGNPWSAGRHVVRLFAKDANNYQTERSEVVFTVGRPVAAEVHGRLVAPTVRVPTPRQQVPGVVGFVGRAPGAVRVEFLEHDVSVGATDVDPDGNWAWERGRPWKEGEHTLEAFALDTAGRVSPRGKVTFTVTHAHAASAHPGRAREGLRK